MTVTPSAGPGKLWLTNASPLIIPPGRLSRTPAWGNSLLPCGLRTRRGLIHRAATFVLSRGGSRVISGRCGNGSG
jgi:hypothetical protein